MTTIEIITAASLITLNIVHIGWVIHAILSHRQRWRKLDELDARINKTLADMETQ